MVRRMLGFVAVSFFFFFFGKYKMIFFDEMFFSLYIYFF